MASDNPIPNNPFEEPRLHYATNLKGELDYDAAIRGSFGLWKDAPVDGLAYQEKIRSEWDR